MSSEVNEVIIEGFICPICLNIYGTADILSLHFQSVHLTTPCSIGNSKKQAESQTKAAATVSFAYYDRPQKLENKSGHSISLTKEFVEQRKCALNRNASECSSLLIRLDKLVTAAKKDYANLKDFEKTVVPWIDSKAVKLCPSCGNSFGIGVEPAFPEETSTPPVFTHERPSENGHGLRHMARTGKQKISQLTKALLDYNPVYRRRHHCRLCGHLICADCSLFIPLHLAEGLLSQVDYGQNIDISVLQYLYNDDAIADKKIDEFEKANSSTEGNTPSSYTIRMCTVCKNLLWRKWGTPEISVENSSFLRMHTELRNHMDKVIEASAPYLSVANSLNCGERKYTLELASTMREELLGHLQAIDSIMRRWDSIVKKYTANEDTPVETGLWPNSAEVRLLRSATCFARNFIQEHQLTVRDLPSLQQYESLTARRRDELALRWQQEDDALVELKKRMGDAGDTKNPTGTPKPRTNGTPVALSTDQEKLIAKQTQLAEAIDEVSAKILASKDPAQTKQLMRRMSSLEKEMLTLKY